MSPEEGVKGDNTQNPDAETAKGAIVFQDKIEIYIDKPLPIYNAGPNLAYRATMQDKSGTPLIALVCARNMAARNSALSLYKSIINPNLLQLIDSGILFWPPAQQERLIFFYLQNIGKPLLTEGPPQALGIKPDEVTNLILRPIVNTLWDLRDKDFVHGNIRLSNMFDNLGRGKSTQIILGDCLSTPASYLQPALYEPIPRAMTDPIARGKGMHSDDMYSFGVSLAVALRHHDPLFGQSHEELLKQKISFGSYAVLIGKDRLKGEMLELLRGLLYDDASQRWTLDDVLYWLEGHRLNPKHGTNIKRPSRPMSFGSEKFLSLPLLASAVSKHTPEAKKILEDDSLYQWIERSVQDEELLERFQRAQSKITQAGIGNGYEDRIACNLSIALDPQAPLRYKGLNILGEGLGAALLEAIDSKKSLAAFAEIISFGLITNWLEAQSNSSYDISALYNKFELCRRYLRSNKIGEGLERCLYFLCPDSHCLSESLQPFYVKNPEDILFAFDKLCAKNQPPRHFIDRHIAAFLFQKDSRLIDTCAFDLNTGEQHRIIMATLKCFANIQKRYKVENLPALTKALIVMLPVLLKRFHDRSAREAIEKSVHAIAETGDLQKMLSVLDNTEFVKQDNSLYRSAMKEYALFEAERVRLEKDLETKERFGIELGKEWAAIFSCIIAALFILITTLSFLS